MANDVAVKPCILCVTITGSVPTKADNPAVPISTAEQIESTHAALIARAADLCETYICPMVSPAWARDILGLRTA